jgi:membrane-associated protease RseP (regulator of RpoE activity)
MLFLISLIIAIFLHELGHLVTAKLVKCKVETFSIGFGRPLLKKKIGETTYQICPILLGGYNKLKDELKYSRSKYAFTNLRYRDKMFIISAGCIMNIVTGLISMLLSKLSFGYSTHFILYYQNYNLFYFGWLSVLLGITNFLPIPALDGSYPILVWLEKIYGKKKGYAIMERICKVGFILLMILNIACIPYIVKMIMKGAI